jgi:hypothetical protein
MRNGPHITRLVDLILLLCLLSSLILVPVNGQSQEDMKVKTDEALKVFNKNIPQGLARLRELGAPAVPYVLDYIRTTDRPLLKIVLLSFVSSANGKEADEAILSLLNEKDPNLRGYAASSVGTRKLKAAVPRLAELLQDREVYMHVVVNDGVDYDVLIRDKAIEALESITGLILEKKGSKDKKARAWLRWWQKEQNQKSVVDSHAAVQQALAADSVERSVSSNLKWKGL